MLIWTRWGILALLIPIAFVGILTALLEPRWVDNPKPLPVKAAKDKDADDTDEMNAAGELEAAKVAEKKRYTDHEMAVKRAKNRGIVLGGLASAAVLWPLGRWMNASENRTQIDPQTGQAVDLQVGGGHTFFFIPMEYWAFIWIGIGLLKFLT